MNLKNQKGAAVVEFALIAVLLFWLLFGIIEFSICLYDKQMITNASREGARYGILADSPKKTIPEIKQKVKDYARQYLVTFSSNKLEDVNIDISWTGTQTYNDYLTVKVNYQYNFLVLPRFVDGLLGNIRATTVMKYE